MSKCGNGRARAFGPFSPPPLQAHLALAFLGFGLPAPAQVFGSSVDSVAWHPLIWFFNPRSPLLLSFLFSNPFQLSRLVCPAARLDAPTRQKYRRQIPVSRRKLATKIETHSTTHAGIPPTRRLGISLDTRTILQRSSSSGLVSGTHPDHIVR